MNIRIKGTWFKYELKYHKWDRDYTIGLPEYKIYRTTSIFQNGEWKDCSLHFYKDNSKWNLLVRPSRISNDGITNLGKVDENGNYDKIVVSRFINFLIGTYERLFFLKLSVLGLLDRMSRVKKNLSLISVAFLGSAVYFLVNHFFDNYIQRVINESNLIQSLIVFLSLSSLINIFHPFTIRKEMNINDMEELIEKKAKKAKEDLENEEYVKRQML